MKENCKKMEPQDLFDDIRRYLLQMKAKNLVYMSEGKLVAEQPVIMPPTVAAKKTVSEPEQSVKVISPVQCSPMTDEIKALIDEIASCKKCDLAKTRTQTVFGHGNTNADLVFIGEAPGANEDRTGIPFCGAAGNLLNKELERNGITRAEVFIRNCLKCRPPENRDPLESELILCEKYMLRQLQLINPKILCVLGRFAASVLLKRSVPIMRERGKWTDYNSLPLFICLHPAAVLHQPNNRKLFEVDIAALAQKYHSLKNA